MATAVDVYLEIGPKKSFACAVDWPGWCRVGKGEEAALEALLEYAERYRPVLAAAGRRLPRAVELRVVERVPGSGATDFGVPHAVPELDLAPMTRALARRTADVVQASWDHFDRVAAAAPAELRKGPRGGGRNRDKIVEHVIGSDLGYAQLLGIKAAKGAESNPAAVADVRAAVLDVLRSTTDGQPVRPKGWPTRYAARRIAWHALDHAWEIEDRSDR
jgi:hypothetical protein